MDIHGHQTASRTTTTTTTTTLASTAQRQFRIGLCVQLVLWGHGGYIYSDKEENTCRQSWLGLAGYDAPCAVFPSVVEARGDSTGAVLGPFDMPVVFASGAFGQTARKTVEIPQVQFFDKVVQISCRCAEADAHGPTVCRTKEFPLLLDKVIDGPVVQFVQLPRWWSRRAVNSVFHSCISRTSW